MQRMFGAEPERLCFILWGKRRPSHTVFITFSPPACWGRAFDTPAVRNEDFNLSRQSGCERSIGAQRCTLMSFVQPASRCQRVGFE